MINRRYAVLGLLIEQPDYGYRRTRRMRERLGSMQSGRTYVYDLLKGRKEYELVHRSAEERGANGSTRVFFAATERDAAYFAEWMGASAAIVPLYEELHLKVAFSREAVGIAVKAVTVSLGDLVDALGPHLVSTVDRISARLGYRRDDELPRQA